MRLHEDELVPEPATTRRQKLRRWGIGILAVIALFAAAAWQTRATPGPFTNTALEWKIELSANADRSVRALVFGEEAGIHLVRIPGADASVEERRTVAARLARGDVYLVSLGLPSLHVRTKGPPGSGVIEMSAKAPFVKLTQRPEATGIRTGWW